MPSAFVHITAGEGDSIITGEANFSEHRWVSIVDNVGDDPLTEVIRLAPIGSLHPFPLRFPGIVVVGYRKGENLDEGKSWYIYVVYGPQNADTIYQWVRDIHPGNETRELEMSLEVFSTPGQGIGPPPFLVAPSKPLGQPVYRLAKNGETPTHRTDGVFGDPLNLVLKGEFEPRPITITRGITPITYSITVPQLTARTVRGINSWKWFTNTKGWLLRDGRYVYAPWEIMYTDFECHDFVMPIPASGRSFAAWYSRCTIHLAFRSIHPVYDPHGWRGYRSYHKFKDEFGHERRVLRDDPVDGLVDVYDNFATHEEFDLRNLFLQVGSSEPGN